MNLDLTAPLEGAARNLHAMLRASQPDLPTWEDTPAILKAQIREAALPTALAVIHPLAQAMRSHLLTEAQISAGGENSFITIGELTKALDDMVASAPTR